MEDKRAGNCMSSEIQEYSMAVQYVNAGRVHTVVHYLAAMKLLLTVFALAFAVPVSASDKLEQTLNRQYKKHIYTLRQPMTAPTQQYDSLGNSPTASALGPWTIYARVEIRKIKLELNRLVVEGQRIGMKFNNHSKSLVPTKLDDKVKLEISLGQPLDSPDQVRTIFSHIFAFSKEDFLASVPEIWRHYLATNLESYPDDGGQLLFKPYLPSKVADKKPEPQSNDIFHVGNGVTAPKARFTPDPTYSMAARGAKFQGTSILSVIVDKNGAVQNILLARPAGLGLDEESVQAVRTWKFDPAKRNGEPVAVEVSVEVTFNLY